LECFAGRSSLAAVARSVLATFENSVHTIIIEDYGLFSVNIQWKEKNNIRKKIIFIHPSVDDISSHGGRGMQHSPLPSCEDPFSLLMF
jgi:hypothetical protein